MSNIQDYMSIRTRLVHENLSLKLRAKQFELTKEAAIKALNKDASDPWLYYYRAEAQRRSAAEPEAAAKESVWLYGKTYNDELVDSFKNQKKQLYGSAKNDFMKCLELDQSFAVAYRGLGLIAYDEGNKQIAVANLSLYLEKGEKINDARYIRALLREVSNEN